MLCDLLEVAKHRRLNGTSKPYAWLVMMFIHCLRTRSTYETFLDNLVRSSDEAFDMMDFFTRSDEAFLLAVMESEVQHWEQQNLEEKKLAWLWFQVSIDSYCIGQDNGMIILVFNGAIDIYGRVVGEKNTMRCVCKTLVWNSLCLY